MKKDLLVKHSDKYQGLGVFALRDFKEGEIVNYYPVFEIQSKDYELLSKKEKSFVNVKDNKYYKLDEVTKFINHSCSPNTISPVLGVDIALRDIKVGEEVTAFYLLQSERGFACVCGSENCQISVENISK
jgi:SET domain-containing protein